MRLVIDTDVLVAGIRSDQGASRQLLLLVLDHQIVMLASVPLMLEYEAVLMRPEQIEQTGLSAEQAATLLDALAAAADPVELRFLWRPMLKNAADEMVLETAVNGRADYLVTFNLRHFEEAAKRFGIHARRPGEVLREFRGGADEKK